ncbi:MAG: hypothetical protein AAF555_02595 [Verrucomicrobiota bacterium]
MPRLGGVHEQSWIRKKENSAPGGGPKGILFQTRHAKQLCQSEGPAKIEKSRRIRMVAVGGKECLFYLLVCPKHRLHPKGFLSDADQGHHRSANRNQGQDYFSKNPFAR